MRQVIIYATLLVALLLGAWFRWTAAPVPDADGKVVLLAGDADQIDSIVWKSKDAETTITRKKDDHGSYLWVSTTKWEDRKLPPKPPVADAPVEPAPPAEPAAEPTTERIERKSVFKASDKGDKLLADLSPLYALRKLDQLDDAKLAEIGLDAPKESLVLTRHGKATTLSIGGESYGTKDRYVRDEDTKTVYLVDDQLLKTLQYAKTRLPDRSLWSLKRPDIARAEISTGTGKDAMTVQAVQQNPDDPKKAAWVRADAAEGDVDEQLTTWMGKALKLKGTRYVDPQADDGPKDLQPRFTMKLESAGKALPETLEVLQDGDGGDFYGRSEHTRGLLKLLRSPTRAVVDDVSTLAQ
ncbi:MAG: DUF4340 domain-containing protein [Oligoflexia bacterium]|nr:DUF4340 domain-containing protein [Oligoflexia bacterium]